MDQNARMDALATIKAAVVTAFRAGHLHDTEANEMLERLNGLALMSAAAQESRERYGFVR